METGAFDTSTYTKRCTQCGGEGPFGRRIGVKDGLKAQCKKCCSAKQAIYRIENPGAWASWAEKNADRLKAKDASRYASDPKAEKERVAAYKAANPEKRNLWQLKSNLAKYGITPDDKQVLFDKQGGKCPICFDSLKMGRTGMQVDHNHRTGKVRGLLCHLCNVMLGDFRESTLWLETAIAYLARPSTEPTCERPKEAGKAGTRASNLWYSYGLTEAGFKELLAHQNNACAICQESFGLKTAHADHDHGLGRKNVRGLLCRSCNFGLGHARESTEILRRAVIYLQT